MIRGSLSGSRMFFVVIFPSAFTGRHERIIPHEHLQVRGAGEVSYGAEYTESQAAGLQAFLLPSRIVILWWQF